MKKFFYYSIVTLLLLVSSNAFSDQPLRIYCEPNGKALVEHRVDGNYTAWNVVRPLPWFVVDKEAIPKVEYSGQLRCSGNSLVVDHSYKPERAVHQEQIKQARAALDEELGKAEPDVITVVRLQRTIELLKEEGRTSSKIGTQ